MSKSVNPATVPALSINLSTVKEGACFFQKISGFEAN